MRKWLPLVAICSGAFMLLIDVTIVTVALPDMARSLRTSFSELQWVIDGYALVLAALDPMLDLSLLRNRAFSALLIADALLSAAAWADMVYESLWLQSLLGKSAISASLILLPAAVMAFVVSAGLGRQMHRLPARGLIGTGMVIIAAGALAQAVVRSGSAAWVLMPGIALVGAGAGLVMAPLTSATMALVPHQKAGMAAGTLTTFRQLGYALGIAVLGEVFSGGLSRIAGSRLAPSLSGGLANAVLAKRPGLPHLVHEAFASGLAQTLVTGSALGLAGAVAAFAFVHLPRQAGAARADSTGCRAAHGPRDRGAGW